LEVPPHAIVIFGATGDLARRKLLPGLLRLFQAGLMPQFRIIGVARSEINDARFRAIAESACREFAHPA
jgi:glucose-6-phosphate 1-dehydrogenase